MFDLVGFFSLHIVLDFSNFQFYPLSTFEVWMFTKFNLFCACIYVYDASGSFSHSMSLKWHVWVASAVAESRHRGTQTSVHLSLPIYIVCDILPRNGISHDKNGSSCII